MPDTAILNGMTLKKMACRIVDFFGVEETAIDAASAQSAVMYGPARGPVICRLDFHGWG